MKRFVRKLSEVDRTQIGLVGGKGANLGELSKIEGIRVPAGFVVTTEAEGHDVTSEIAAHIDAGTAYAVRSSATAEDLPTASFAGQHDSYLNVVGLENVVEHVRRCVASLFTERAITYRQQNGFGDRKVRMAVVVQQMIPAQAAGVMFTADPVTGNRKVVAIEAVAGLGEALVSGLVTPERYEVRDGNVVASGVLTKDQVLRLAALGRRIEAHFGSPRDIEWCLLDDEFHFVQSRPITTLFPIPEVNDGENHVYVSVGHQQMMTDASKPLAISIRQLTTRAVFHAAGGRLFVDVSRLLATPSGRTRLLTLAQSEPLFGDALDTVVASGFIPSMPDPPAPPAPAPIVPEPGMVQVLMADSQASIAALKRDIEGKAGIELFDFLRSDFEEMKRVLFDPRSNQTYMAAIDATGWLNEKLHAWLGEKNVADTLTLSVPNNVTSEMGLALLDVADVIRPYAPALEAEDFPASLPPVAREALMAFLEKYGMRCVGEIDITRPRWSESPAALVPILRGNIRSFEPGEAKRHFERGLMAARNKEAEILERLRALPDGEAKAKETKTMIDRVRTFIGYREYPKYGMVRRYFVYRKALLAEAERLVEAHVMREREDIYYLTFAELENVVRTQHVDEALLRRRKDEFRSHEALTPPRVLTSDGEAIRGAYRRDHLPAGALVGLAVSAGTVEGRARVVRDLADANLEPGDILVTAFTDPSWTPLFVAIKGLVTEVGGLMTHGSVIAREYGLPAVVSVENATRLIEDGQRIRVHGTEGFVEIL